MDLSNLGPAGAAAAIVYFFLKYMKEERNSREQMITRMTTSIDHNSKVSKQTLDFMKNLNGELKKAAAKKLDP